MKVSQYTINKSNTAGSCLLSACLFCLLSFAYVPQADAGTFSVTPVRIYMLPKDRATAMTISNDSDEELVMQADLYEWKQKPDGQDDLTLTEDMFLSPPIIKMAPKSKQVVRLARIKPVKSASQITYRMIVREIPEARVAKDEVNVQIALAFSMPVFITPPGAKAKLNCTLERIAEDAVKANCENTGTAYSHPTTFVLSSSDGDKIAHQDTGGYILPDIKRSFDIKRENATIPSGQAKLVATLDDGTTQTFDVTIP